MQIEINGIAMKLGKHESMADYCCPQCGSKMIVNHGPGISITFCVKCDYSDVDYDDIFDME